MARFTGIGNAGSARHLAPFAGVGVRRVGAASFFVDDDGADPLILRDVLQKASDDRAQPEVMRDVGAGLRRFL